jgi:hypothetical protein
MAFAERPLTQSPILLQRRCPRYPLPKTLPSLWLLKKFLDGYLIYNGHGPKEMLRGKVPEDVLNKLEILNSPYVRNIITSFGSASKGGVFDSIMSMKRYTTIEYIHGNVFLRQGKEKVYVFKMLVDRPGSGLDLVKHMQLGGDLENAWLMFDHVKHVQA